ncbi:MAG: hypothetical protein ACREL7_15570 [Longimicrobiales bacterium]
MADVDAATNAVRSHIRDCATCAAAIEELRRDDAWVASMLSTLDSPPPALDALRREPRQGEASPWIRRAAAVLLLATLAGAGWALPGSPVRSWLLGTDRRTEGTRSVANNESAYPVTTLRGGLDIPADGNVLITFAQAQTRGSIRIVVSDSAGVRLTILNDDARLESPSERHVIVDNSESAADYAIRVSRAATDVTVRIGDRIVFRKTRDQVISATAPARDGAYVLPLGPSGS